MSNHLNCWVCDTAFEDGESVLCCLHPDDDGVSSIAQIMCWCAFHEKPIESRGKEIKEIVLRYEEITGVP